MPAPRGSALIFLSPVYHVRPLRASRKSTQITQEAVKMNLSLIRSMTRSAVFELENGQCFRPAHPFAVTLNGKTCLRSMQYQCVLPVLSAARHRVHRGRAGRGRDPEPGPLSPRLKASLWTHPATVWWPTARPTTPASYRPLCPPAPRAAPCMCPPAATAPPACS